MVTRPRESTYFLDGHPSSVGRPLERDLLVDPADEVAAKNALVGSHVGDLVSAGDKD
jgi:hypothetical protein